MVNDRLKRTGPGIEICIWLGSFNHFRLPVTNILRKDGGAQMSNRNGARPLSGEIIDVQRPIAQVRAAAGNEVIDAEYETVTPSKVRGKADSAAPEHGPGMNSSAQSTGMDMLKRAAFANPDNTSQKAGPAFWLVGAAVALAAFWVSGGHVLMPVTDTVIPKQAAGHSLRIAAVDSRVETRNGKSVLFVDGEIFNPGMRQATIPDVSINVLDHGGRTTRYYLGTNSRRIGAGDRFDFSSRVHVPKDGVKSVSVTLQEKPGRS